MKRSLSNVGVILDDITFSEIYIHISLANTHESLGKYQKSILISPQFRSPRRLPSG